jgi:uncharacterized protein with GYD domain
MLFISLARFRRKPTKEMIAQVMKLHEQTAKEGGKIVSIYWTLGRYDTISIIEGKDEKTAMTALLRYGDFLSTETLVAVPAQEARKLVE